VVYVPQWAGNSKNGAEYRFIAIRESFKGKMSKKDSPGQLPILELIEDLEQGNEKIKKLHLTELKGNVYKIFGIVIHDGKPSPNGTKPDRGRQGSENCVYWP
jgi:hypothetical protein